MNTRIIIYTGHRDIGLVLASHYFLNKNLVMPAVPAPTFRPRNAHPFGLAFRCHLESFYYMKRWAADVGDFADLHCEKGGRSLA